MVVERSDNYSLVISRGSKRDSCRSEDATDGESAGESDSSSEERFREPAFQNRSSIVIFDDSSQVSSFVNDRIGVIKHDPENCRWKVTMDKGKNTGTFSFNVKSDLPRER